MITGEKGCFGSPYYHVLKFHNSFRYISNFTDIFIVVQKIISWKVGKAEFICLHGDLCSATRKAERRSRPYIGRMAKNVF